MPKRSESSSDGAGSAGSDRLEAATSAGRLSAFARTDRGTRPRNQDAFIVADLSAGRSGLGPDVATHELGTRGSLFAVADGAGDAGETASDLALSALHRVLAVMPEDLAPTEHLRRGVHHVARFVHGRLAHSAGGDRSTTTLTAVLMFDGAAYVAQVGDSRAYLLREGELRQLTKDQTLAQALADAGGGRGGPTATSPPNIMLQALGGTTDVRPIVTTVDLQRGDVFLVCTDGVSDALAASVLAHAAAEPDLAESCRRIVELAVARGTGDNATVVLVRVDALAVDVEPGEAVTWTFPEAVDCGH